jgi:hypothetical protein
MSEDNINHLTRVVNGWGNGNDGFKLDTSINGHQEANEAIDVTGLVRALSSKAQSQGCD